MLNFDLFSSIPPIGHLYFFYGLAFFLLGVSIVSKNLKSSNLKFARSLYFLAGFGFTHGTHEWIELYVILQRHHLPASEMFPIKLFAVFFVILSFLLLLQFGISLVRSVDDRSRRMKWLNAVPAFLFFVWVFYLWNTVGFGMDDRFFHQAEISARRIFCFLGGLLTAYGLIKAPREVKSLSRSVSKKFYYAGIFFIFYAVFSGIVPSRTALSSLKIPVEVFRGLSALFITYFVIKGLNVFDIETRKKLELQLKRLAQSEKLVSLGQLAAGIAHEINHPLTNISLSVQLLRDRLEAADNADALKKFDAIENNINKASTIARELLHFSRNAESNMILLNINKVIQGALTLMQYKFRDIRVNLDLSDVPDIIGDPVKLEQVFLNILDNAVNAMHGSGNLRISGAIHDNWITIKIADSGAGIPKANISRVFEPFYTTKDVGEGTGLGLSICYGIITQHKGEIDIESSQGEGTTVIIRLPIAGDTIK